LQNIASHSVGSPPPINQNSIPTVTIVICTRNRVDDLRKCLEAIARLDPKPDEVLIVDNTKGDKAVEALALEFSVRYSIEPVSGLSRARNRGIAESKSEIVAYLDDDAMPAENWLEFLLLPFADREVAVVTGGTIEPGTSQGNRDTEPTRFLSNKDQHWFEIAAFGGLGIGTNMALRRSACLDSEIFDKRLGRGAPLQGMEEHYAYVHLLSLSYRAAHVPSAIVVHPFVQRNSLQEDVSHAIAYWLLLFLESPGHRLELLNFFWRRFRHKPLDWPRNSPPLGMIVTSGWMVRIKAGLKGVGLYFRARKMISK
jgi:glycosyltransferase involved in cell wall biosynthesis